LESNAQYFISNLKWIFWVSMFSCRVRTSVCFFFS